MGLHLSQIAVYPVKSLGAVYPDRAELVETGFLHDRAWMLVDEDGVFITQRQFPWLARVAVRATRDALELRVPNAAPLRVPIATDGEVLSARVWGSECETVDQGETVAKLLGDYIGRPCRLVRMRRGLERGLGESYKVADRTSVGFADSSPLMLVSQASLDDLNARLETPVEMSRFRPNLVIAGGDAFQEDGWRRIRIGDGVFHLVKDCIRCEIPTIDQETGEKGVEPMETLEGYRAGPRGVRFGRKVAHGDLVAVSVGDEVRVLE